MQSMSFTSSRLRLARTRLALVTGIAFAAACGGSSEPKIPPKDLVPATITSDISGTLTAVAGSTITTPLGVTVTNKAGEPLDTVLVTFTVTSGNGTVGSSTVRTQAGKASTTWTLGPAVGTQTVTATVGTLAPVTFTATATVGVPAKITKLSVDPQTAPAGGTVASAPSIKVTDANNNPIANLLVTFAVASGGGTITGGSPSTDANGIATATSWRLGNAPGVNTVTAAASGVTTPVTFTATGTIGTATKVTITSAAIPTLNIGQTATITANAFDANNNQLTSPTFSFTSSNTAVATVSAGGVVTAVGSGTATITVAIGTGSATVNVTVVGHAEVNPVANVHVDGRPRHIATAGNSAYVATGNNGTVVAIDVASNAVAWIDTIGNNVADVAVNAANSTIVAGGSGGADGPQLYFISPTTHKVVDSVALAANPLFVTMNAAGTRAYVNEDDFGLQIIDVPSRTVALRTVIAGTPTLTRLAKGDSLLYVQTRLGTLYELSAATGAVRRSFATSATVVDFDISPDGKTAVLADNSQSIDVIKLAPGGLTGPVDFGSSTIVTGVGFAPDGTQLWLSMNGTIEAIMPDAGTFDPTLIAGRKTLAASFTKIAFLPSGSAALVFDEGSFNLVIFK